MTTGITCPSCGTDASDISNLGRCLQCVRAGSDAWQALCDANRPPVAQRTFAELLKPPEPEPRRPVGVQEPGRAGTPQGRLQGLVNTVLKTPEGERNHVLNWAAYKAAEIVAAGEMGYEVVAEALVDAGQGCGLPVGEAWTTVRSGLRGGGAG